MPGWVTVESPDMLDRRNAAPMTGLGRISARSGRLGDATLPRLGEATLPGHLAELAGGELGSAMINKF